jgi:hypothetical protein
VSYSAACDFFVVDVVFCAAGGVWGWMQFIMFTLMCTFMWVGPDSNVVFVLMGFAGFCYSMLVNNVFLLIENYTVQENVELRGYYVGLVSSAATAAQAWMGAFDGSLVQYAFANDIARLYFALGVAGLATMAMLRLFRLYRMRSSSDDLSDIQPKAESGQPRWRRSVDERSALVPNHQAEW